MKLWLKDVLWSWEQTLRTRREDMLNGWCFKQQRALLWHAFYLNFSLSPFSLTHTEAIVYSLWRTTDTASQPTPVLSGSVASFAVPVYINARTQTSRVAALPSEHAALTSTHTDISPQAHVRRWSRRENEMMMVRWDGWKKQSRWRTSFSLSLWVKW